MQPNKISKPQGPLKSSCDQLSDVGRKWGGPGLWVPRAGTLALAPGGWEGLVEEETEGNQESAQKAKVRN